MPTPTYDSIASFRVTTANSTTISFSSIPTTYTDLRIVGMFYNSYPTITFNNNTNSIYAGVYMNIFGTQVSNGSYGTRANIIPAANLSGDDTYPLAVMMDINSYANTNYNKNLLLKSEVGTNVATGTGSEIHTYVFASTSAISQVTFTNASAQNWPVGTTVSIYGITRGS